MGGELPDTILNLLCEEVYNLAKIIQANNLQEDPDEVPMLQNFYTSSLTQKTNKLECL
jgi:hypothetical protein